jgi:transcriptional regulator with XRE-family HTH domain
MEEILYIEVGKLIKRARLLKKWTQQDLSEQVNLTRASIANIERGKQKISIYTLYLIAKALNVSPHSLLPEPNILQKSENDLYANLAIIKNKVTSEELEWIKSITRKSQLDEGE